MLDFGCDVLPPVGTERLREAEAALGQLPSDLRSLYSFCNGLSSGWFAVLPLFDADRLKATWDSAERANNPSTTRFLARSRDLLARFLVFATIGGNECAVIERTDGSIWFEQGADLHRTDFDLTEFIEACLREVRDGL